MYRPEELRGIELKPKINDITLLVLREYYHMYLMPFVYTYKVVDETNEERNFELRFDSERLCHLLGVESIARGQVRYNQLSGYRGKKGWDNIGNGSVDFKHLKALNKKKFQSVKTKFVYFYLIPDLLEKPLAVKFDGTKVNPPVRIESEILFYSTYENAVIHLGIDKNDKEDFYFPRTFFVEKLGDSSVEDIYTVNQTKIYVEKKERIILL